MDLPGFFALTQGGDGEAFARALDEDPSRSGLVWNRSEHGESFEDGATPLHVAVRAGQVDRVMQLLDAGAPVDARTSAPGESRTALHDSYEFGQPVITEMLLRRGAHYDIAVAAARGDFARVDELLAEDVGLVEDESTGLSPLGWAGYGQDPKMIPHLLRFGAVLADELLCPAGTGNVEIAQAMLAGGADADRLCPEAGARPLHVAAALRHTEDATGVAKLFLDAGADVNGTTRDGKTTPLDVADHTLVHARGHGDAARQAGATAMITLLEERGGQRSGG